MADDNKATPPTWRPGHYADADGHFRRPQSSFRSSVSSAADSPFPAERGRYVLYVNYGCPWAHRTVIVRALKGLEDVVELAEADGKDSEKGWSFERQADPVYGVKFLKEFYERAAPGFDGRVTVPVLWDRKKDTAMGRAMKIAKKERYAGVAAAALALADGTIVNNESSEIIRMFYDQFDALLPEAQRESTKGEAGLFPPHLRADIEAMNSWVYETVNNGVYKCGFASTQAAYEANIYPLFQSLDRLEEHLADPAHEPYLFGAHITEADIRLYTTLARFDVAYYTIFKCNLRMIRHDFPRLHKWLRTLYWDESEKTAGGAFKNTTRFDAYKIGYSRAVNAKVVPAGPVPDIMPL